MNVNTEHLQRCIRTLESSLNMLRKSPDNSIDYEVYRNAVVKGFELTLETSGKLLRKTLKAYIGSPRGVDVLTFKNVFREALKHGLIEDQETVERWFMYRENRNNTAHDYGVGFAQDTLGLLDNFLKDVRGLETSMRQNARED